MNKFSIATILLLLATGAFAKDVAVKEVKVKISDEGFTPSHLEVQKGEQLLLLVTRTTEKTCIKELKNLSGSEKVKLPLNREITFNFGQLDKSGKVNIQCGMDMSTGVVTVL